MAEGGDSVDSGRRSGGSWRDKIPDNSSLYLGSEGVETLLCREHGQEFKHFCTDHMTELCITCRRMEHRNCNTVIGIEEAADDIYSKIHRDKIGQSVKNLGKRFQDFKSVIEDLKSKIPNKRTAVDKMKQARNKLDDYLDKLQANATDEIDRHLKEYKDTLEEKYDVCTASLTSLGTGSSGFERTMSVGNKAEKFIAINRATKQTKQYCNVLLDVYKEMSEMNVVFKPNNAFTDILRFGSVSVESYKVFSKKEVSKTLPIYTGEMKLKSTGTPNVTSYDLLPDGRNLILDINNNKIQVYDKRNTFVTETVLPVKEDERCASLVLNIHNKALVSTRRGRLFKVKIDDEISVSEIKSKYRIIIMTRYGENVLCVLEKNEYCQLCVIDKDMSKINSTILKDDGTLFTRPAYLGVSADKNIVYVIDIDRGLYGISLDGQVVFHYQNPNAFSYTGLVVDSDRLFLGTNILHELQVERLDLSGKRLEVCAIFGNVYPLKLVENKLVLLTDDNIIEFYCLIK